MAEIIDVDPNSFPSFKGRTAVITGGSSGDCNLSTGSRRPANPERTGIGLSTALLFSTLGANVVIADISPPPASTPTSILFHKTDATSYASLLSLFRTSEAAFGSWPSIVFANAGIGERGDLFGGTGPEGDDIEVEPKHEVMSLDMTAVANTVRIAMWGMRKSGKGGNVVMTASLAGYTGQPGLHMYVCLLTLLSCPEGADSSFLIGTTRQSMA